MITADDLKKGAVFEARNQGMNITPETVQVTVYWVGEGVVHYILKGRKRVDQTTTERFLEIVNAK